MALCGTFPRLRHRALELEGCEVLSVEARGTEVLVRLHGTVHVSAGTPGTDEGTRWSQEVHVRARDATVQLDGAAPFDVVRASTVLLPLGDQGPLTLRLEGVEASLHLVAAQLSVEAKGQGEFVDRFVP